MSNTVVLNLDYTFVIDPKYNNNEIITCYETHNGIWRKYTSKSLSSSFSSSSSNTGYKMIDNYILYNNLLKLLMIMPRVVTTS